ncbi:MULTISPECIES: glycosyltransferase family 2 protein [Pseudomonas]|uniref:glycosyltransferase family 2 protein n=1 Tax=unclassified Pseudomonas TaxID=196821 RepID=UPI000C87D818|nr:MULTISPECIES: glycosyltransferase family 2 protein [unclassified Pseudomonas]PMU87766.1 glycosyltransferase family 2 protein [Pseudomonas sp. GW704-F3]PMU92930.1 glycosyltransferase family 2 protein [Pseudomonas sp. GW704-F5]PMV02559.1 glycosyltransferase family 2 protein [Pseudomonas sp. MPBD4-3]PMV27016.1 glycosyltransferase family 2 protein [Pseudomonas sp. GW704-F2]
MNSSVAAVVVLFKPDLVVLDRLLLSIHEQIQLVYIIDNTPASSIDDYAGRFDDGKLFYKSLQDNYGIARAHNVGAQLAEKAGYSHVLLLDQDSELLPGTVNTLLAEEKKLLDMGVKVGAIGPVFVDEKTGDAAPILRSSFFGTKKIDIDLDSTLPVLSNYIIASGSLIRVSVFSVVGLMQESLFIDWVDIEWGERASIAGYGSYLTPLVTMRHSIGDEFVTLLGKRITLHSDFRNYFIVRNAAYLAVWSNTRIQTRFEFARKVPYYIVCYTLCSKRKLYSAKLLCQAFYDGIVRNMFKGRF